VTVACKLFTTRVQVAVAPAASVNEVPAGESAQPPLELKGEKSSAELAGVPLSSVTVTDSGIAPGLVTEYVYVVEPPAHTVVGVADLVQVSSHCWKLPSAKSLSTALTSADERVSSMKAEKHSPLSPRAVRSMPPSKKSPF
jgi:hypothetical protein